MHSVFDKTGSWVSLENLGCSVDVAGISAGLCGRCLVPKIRFSLERSSQLLSNRGNVGG